MTIPLGMCTVGNAKAKAKQNEADEACSLEAQGVSGEQNHFRKCLAAEYAFRPVLSSRASRMRRNGIQRSRVFAGTNHE